VAVPVVVVAAGVAVAVVAASAVALVVVAAPVVLPAAVASAALVAAVAAAVPRVPSGAPVAVRFGAVSRRSSGVRNSTTCRRRSPVA
jgi:hypothetical protein